MRKSKLIIEYEYDFNLIGLISTAKGYKLAWELNQALGIHLVKQIKSRSSRLLPDEFPYLKSRMPTLCTNSYFVATVGGATLEVVKRYVENQRNV